MAKRAEKDKERALAAGEPRQGPLFSEQWLQTWWQVTSVVKASNRDCKLQKATAWCLEMLLRPVWFLNNLLRAGGRRRFGEGAGKIVPRVKVFATKSDDLSLILRTQVIEGNLLL